MADKVDPRTGELTTANYGWVKPTVGASTDAWGGYINTDLDGIDTTVHSIQTSVPAASSTAPAMDGTAAVGTGTTFARADHVHPSDTTKYNTSNPSGYQTAAQVTASLAPYALTTSLASYLALSGGTMTGAMTLAADPAANLQPATKQYVDGGRLGDNRIINGDMRIDQRNNGAAGTASGYTVDRWSFYASQPNKFTWGRNLNGAGSASGFPYYLGLQSSSSYASLATDIFQLSQPIEADMVSDFAWGTANAQPVTLSFWARSSLTGVFSGSFQNYAQTRSYPFTFSLPTANTWTKIAMTISGDTAGAWVMSGNSGAGYLAFDLGTGSSGRGSGGAWANGLYIGATGAVSIVATNGAVFQVTGVKLEIGSVATPFNRQSLAKSLADCQRYYQGVQFNSTIGPPSTGAGQTYTLCYPYVVSMRANPTMAILANSNVNLSAPTLGANANILSCSATSSAAGAVTINTSASASAEL